MGSRLTWSSDFQPARSQNSRWKKKPFHRKACGLCFEDELNHSECVHTFAHDAQLDKTSLPTCTPPENKALNVDADDHHTNNSTPYAKRCQVVIEENTNAHDTQHDSSIVVFTSNAKEKIIHADVRTLETAGL